MDEQKPKPSTHNCDRSLLSPMHQDYVRALRRVRERRWQINKMIRANNVDLLNAECLAHQLRKQGKTVQISRYAPDPEPDPLPENPPVDGFAAWRGDDEPAA